MRLVRIGKFGNGFQFDNDLTITYEVGNVISIELLITIEYIVLLFTLKRDTSVLELYCKCLLVDFLSQSKPQTFVYFEDRAVDITGLLFVD